MQFKDCLNLSPVVYNENRNTDYKKCINLELILECRVIEPIKLFYTESQKETMLG